MPIINRIGGGGNGIKLNLFVQPDKPTEKNGVWLKTSAKETIKKVVFDTNVWTSGSWNPESQINPIGGAFGSNPVLYNGKLYFLNYSGTTSMCSFDLATKTVSTLKNYPSQSPFGSNAPIQSVNFVLVDNIIYCLCYLIQYASNTRDYTTVYSYNIDTNTFTSLLDYPLASTADMVYDDGVLYNFNRNSHNYYSTDQTYYSTTGSGSYKYVISTNTYTAIANRSETVSSNTVYPIGFTKLVYSKRVYFFNAWWALTRSSAGNIEECFYYDIVSNSYSSAASPSGLYGGICSVLLGDKAFVCFPGDKRYRIYDFVTDTWANQQTSPDFGYCSQSSLFMLQDKILLIFRSSTNNISEWYYELTAKQYPDTPSVIFYQLPKDWAHQASILSGERIDILPFYFKDAMLFKDGEIIYPALYIGNGTSWSLARSAQ